MRTISVIFGFVACGFAVNAQDTGTVARSGQRLPVGTPSNRAVVPKLDTRGKAIYWWRHGFGIGILGADVVAAGISQANDTPPEWQGAAGFGKRLGDTVGSSSIAAGVGFGLSTALHIDPRYYRCMTCGFWGHVGSAATQ